MWAGVGPGWQGSLAAGERQARREVYSAYPSIAARSQQEATSEDEEGAEVEDEEHQQKDQSLLSNFQRLFFVFYF